MKRSVFFIIVVLACLAFAVSAQAVTYKGSLSWMKPLDSTDGLVVGTGGNWENYGITMAWEVTNEDTSYTTPTSSGYFPWKYTYTLSLSNNPNNQSGISHVIIETSPECSQADFAGLTGAIFYVDGTGLPTNEPTTQQQNNGNPSIPGAVYGIKFAPNVSSPQNMSWSFWCNRAPVWGDFYCKDGNAKNYAFNRGFTAGDVDPIGAPSNGSLDWNILRPDTIVEPPPTVPEPGTILAALSILAPAGMIFRRRKF